MTAQRAATWQEDDSDVFLPGRIGPMHLVNGDLSQNTVSRQFQHALRHPDDDGLRLLVAAIVVVHGKAWRLCVERAHGLTKAMSADEPAGMGAPDEKMADMLFP